MIKQKDLLQKVFLTLNLKFEHPQVISSNAVYHTVIKCTSNHYYLVTRNDFFHTFNFRFPEFKDKYSELSGVGDSMQLKYLDRACELNAVLLFGYCHTDEVYEVDRNKLIHYLSRLLPESDFSYVSTCKLLKLFISMHGLVTEDNFETKYNFPIKLLKRYE